MMRNPFFYMLLVLVAMTSMKLVYQGENKIEQMERISRICSTIPQPHPDCDGVKTFSSQAADKNRSFEYD